MARIVIKDSLGVELVSANPQVTSGFGRYLKNKAADLLAATDVVSQLRTPVDLANPGESGLGLTWSQDVPLGDTAALSIDAGARARIGVFNRPSMVLLDGTFIAPPLKVPPGLAFVSFAFRPTLNVAVKQAAGALSFGFSAGSEAELVCYRPVDLSGPPLLAKAVADVLELFIVPNTSDDLKAMRALPTGALACVSGHGRLQIGATVNVAAAFNPLASVDTLPKLGKLQVSGGASATVGVAATLSGGFQFRARRMEGALVQLSVHTMAGRGLDVSLSAGAGAGVKLGDRDLTAMLFGGPGGLSGAAREDLVKGGITREQLDRVTAAMEAGLSRRLELAVQAQFSKLVEDEAVFLYEVDLDQLDATGDAAIDRALAGDLTALNELETEGAAHGLRVLRSGTKTLREKQVSWRINLVGIVNILSMRDLVRTGTVVHDEESGELVIVDKITSDHVGATIGRKQIRKLLYESAVMTLTYKASGLDVNSDLSAAQSFFFFDKDANRQRVSDYLDAVAALGLIAPGDIARQIAGDDEFGKASLLLETTFDQQTCERVFGLPGPPPTQGDYEAIGRRALGALVKPADPDAYRRIPMIDDALWKSMRDSGTPGFRFILPPPITGGNETRQAIQVAVVAADYTTIVWWASAMELAAKLLAEMRTFLNGRAPIELEKDAGFRKRRSEIERAMAKAIQRNTSTFDDPWGLIALFMASGGRADATATIVSPRLTLFLPE